MSDSRAARLAPAGAQRTRSNGDAGSTPASRTPDTAASDVESARRQAARLNLLFDSLDRYPDDPGLWSQVPIELMVRFGCVPVDRAGGRSTRACTTVAGAPAPASRSSRTTPQLVGSSR